MNATSVLLSGPKDLGLEVLELQAPTPGDVLVEISHSGISTGTEKLFWSGEMPPFPGMGYPLVPGYESTGEVVEVVGTSPLKVGDRVFVPGANCYTEAKGLFGGASNRVITSSDRVTKIDRSLGPDGALLALAATARHAIAGLGNELPDLIVGHGVLGRLLARLTIAAGGAAPTVWEIDPSRSDSDGDYAILHPDDDPRRDYGCIFDASGQADLLNELIARLRKGGEIVLAGFYPSAISFAFPPAFMKEARFRVAAEWTAEDMQATQQLIDGGDLSLAGLVTHMSDARGAKRAYAQAFEDPTCLKMILDWRQIA